MDLDKHLIEGISEQYGAALQMLENIIINCQEDLWQDFNRETIISHVIYHTMFFIDYYLSKNDADKENFKAKLGDDLMGERTDGLKWDKIYSKDELLNYLADIRKKANERFSNTTLQELNEKPIFDWHGKTVLSSLLYNLRHIMLHVGALHVRVNAVNKEPMKWVSKQDL